MDVSFETDFEKISKHKFLLYYRKEYLEYNPFLKYYFDQPNIQVGTYGDLERWSSNNIDQIKWRRL